MVRHALLREIIWDGPRPLHRCVNDEITLSQPVLVGEIKICRPDRTFMSNRPEKLRQVIARYERLIEGASPEMAAVYAAEIAAVRGMLRIEAVAANASKDDPNCPPGGNSEMEL